MEMLFRALLGIFVALWLPVHLFALDQFDLHSQSTKSLALSGANIAIGEDLSVFSKNPAGISRFAETRLFGLDNRYFKQGRNWSLGLGLIDGKTEDPLHWGFHINTVHTKDIEEDQYSLGTAFNYENLLLLGISHRLTKFHNAVLTRDGLYFAMNAGLLAFVSDYVSLGVAVQNGVRSENFGSVMPFRAGGGIGCNFRHMRTDIDLERDFSQKTWVVKIGSEFRISDAVILQTGWNQNLTHKDKGYSLGSSVVLLNNANLDFGFLDQLNSSNITFSGGVSVKL